MLPLNLYCPLHTFSSKIFTGTSLILVAAIVFEPPAKKSVLQELATQVYEHKRDDIQPRLGQVFAISYIANYWYTAAMGNADSMAMPHIDISVPLSHSILRLWV